MKISILRKDVDLTAEDRQRIVNLIRLALTRFSALIRGVSVTVADENGTRGGVDKSCRLVIQMGAGTVVVSQQGASVVGAAAEAAGRAARSVARLQHRAFDPRKTRRALRAERR